MTTVDTYVSNAPDKKADNAIIFLTDIYGLPAVASKLLADSFARAGYLVVVPDYFKGEPMPAQPGNMNMTEWQKRHPDSEIESILTASIQYAKSLGAKRIGAVGYCYGGKFVARLLAKGKGFDVGFFAHPSRLTTDELKAVAGPLSIGAAETDAQFPAPKRVEAEGALQALKLPYQINLYGGVSHGFAVRANVADKAQKYAKEEAYLQAVRWFDTWLKV
jgi:dienelactone hydrolase